MRTMLLTSAALLSLACMPAAFAQSAPPDEPPTSMAPPATTDAPPPADAGAPASDGTGMAAPGMTMHHHHHHMAAAPAPDADPTTFAHEPGTGLSGPASNRASNIDAGDSRSPIAPHLPQPGGGMNAWGYLRAADHDLATRQTGAAQQALEMAETRFLDRSIEANAASQPNQGPIVTQVSQARQALGHGDIAGARTAIRMALDSAPKPGMPAGEGMGAPAGGMQPGMQPGPMQQGAMSPGGMAPGGMATSQPGGAPMGNGTPTSASMAPSGAGPTPGATAGSAMGGGTAGTGTTDSAGGAK